MKPLTTSVYTFEKLISGGCLYVDKTAQIHGLITEPWGQYFLSRPRRFGKSLLVSTLKAVFQGRRELFAGLAIDRLPYDWQVYPVIHLDLGSCQADTPGALESKLTQGVNWCAAELGVALTAAAAADRFLELVRQVGTRGRAVILVDEYDKPLLGALGDAAKARELLPVLKGFYSVIKTTEAQQRFALLTGVSKFSKVSVFSDLNNLTDLTMSRAAATLLGYTQAELESNFPEHIAALAAALGTTYAATLAELRDWYNGYRFHPEAETVYNPVSVMKCFQEREFKNYWFETGTPTFLIDLLRRTPLNLDNLDVPESAFAAYEPQRLEPLPLLAQTGYLTLAGATRAGDLTYYRLGFPNREISLSFSYWLARDFAALPDQELSGALRRMVAALERNDVPGMLADLKTFFAQIPNTIGIDNEKYYQTIFFTVFTLIGAMTEAEVNTNSGRIDAVVKTRTDIFIFEFKLAGTAQQAMRQIREKRYVEPYLADGRRITLVGVAFSKKTRNLGRCLIEPV